MESMGCEVFRYLVGAVLGASNARLEVAPIPERGADQRYETKEAS